MVRVKLRRALDSVGKTNGHACPPSASNVDPLLHELFVSSEASAYWKTRHDRAKDAALEACTINIDEVLQSVTALDQGTSVTCVTGELYTMTMDISKPAARLNQTALRNHMQTVLGLSKAQVDEAFDAASSKASPAKKIRVTSR
jgi:hypothetical protein